MLIFLIGQGLLRANSIETEAPVITLLAVLQRSAGKTCILAVTGEIALTLATFWNILTNQSPPHTPPLNGNMVTALPNSCGSVDVTFSSALGVWVYNCLSCWTVHYVRCKDDVPQGTVHIQECLHQFIAGLGPTLVCLSPSEVVWESWLNIVATVLIKKTQTQATSLLPVI